jgi:hypothetical protein
VNTPSSVLLCIDKFKECGIIEEQYCETYPGQQPDKNHMPVCHHAELETQSWLSCLWKQVIYKQINQSVLNDQSSKTLYVLFFSSNGLLLIISYYTILWYYILGTIHK